VVVDTKTEELEVAWGLLGLIVIVITVTNIYWASAILCQVFYIQHLI